MLDLLKLYDLNHALHEPWHTLSSLAYSILIVATFCGNLIVMVTILVRKELWTARNFLILNLALSDISKCSSILD